MRGKREEGQGKRDVRGRDEREEVLCPGGFFLLPNRE
jgi:hypothetical protein